MPSGFRSASRHGRSFKSTFDSPSALVIAESLMDARPAQVAIDDQCPAMLLGVRHRQMNRDRRFAFRGRGAGHEQRPELAVEIRQQDRIAQRANGFLVSRQASGVGSPGGSQRFSDRPRLTTLWLVDSPSLHLRKTTYHLRLESCMTCSGSRMVVSMRVG